MVASLQGSKLSQSINPVILSDPLTKITGWGVFIVSRRDRVFEQPNKFCFEMPET